MFRKVLLRGFSHLCRKFILTVSVCTYYKSEFYLLYFRTFLPLFHSYIYYYWRKRNIIISFLKKNIMVKSLIIPPLTNNFRCSARIKYFSLKTCYLLFLYKNTSNNKYLQINGGLVILKQLLSATFKWSKWLYI